MKLTTSDKLTEFIEAVEDAKIKLEELRNTIKMETSEKIKEKIETEKLEEANILIEELSLFLKVQFECNAEEIENYAKGLGSKDKSSKNESQKYTMKTFKQETEEDKKISKREIELLKEIAENGYFDKRQLRNVTEEELISLNRKELLEIETNKASNGYNYQFRLTNKGARLYKEHFDRIIKESSKEEIIEEFGNTSKGLLLFETRKYLVKNGYEIESISEQAIETMKDGALMQITPDFGSFEERDYEEILDKTNQLKKIGFVSETEEIMKKQIEAVEKWVSRNKGKSRMLKVYFTNISKLKEKEPFLIKKY